MTIVSQFQTGLDRAREVAKDLTENHGKPSRVLAGWCQTNEYDISDPRGKMFAGHLVETTAPGGSVIFLWTMGEFTDITSAVFLIDDGSTVQPMYVGGYQGYHGQVAMFPIPTNTRSDGTKVDMSQWMLAPSKFYHMKVNRDLPLLNGLPY